MNIAVPTIDSRFRSVADLSRVHGTHRPDHQALIFEGRTTTWAALDRQTSRIANQLRAQVPPQSRIAYLGKNSDRFFGVYLAAAKARMVLVPVNWRLAEEEIAFILQDAQVRILFVGADYLPLIATLRATVQSLKVVVAVDGQHPGCEDFETWSAAASDDDPQLSSELDEVVLQLYTSGTTGLPKGAELTHRNVLTAPSHGASGWLGSWNEADICLVPLPLFHAGGVIYGTYPLYVGGTLIVLREAQAGPILQAMARHPVTKLGVVPAVLQAMLEHSDCERTDFSRLDAVTYGGAPIPPALLREALEAMGPVFVQMFGMTETATLGTALQPADHCPTQPERLSSCGRALPGVDIRVVTIDGRPACPGESGEVHIRSAAVMKGYWNRPEANAEALRDGWYRSGDVGYVDIDGFLFIQDRLKDMIITGGENVYPAEVERVLGDHTSILEAAVIGVPDARWGEAVKAVVVQRPGHVLTEAEVIAYARTRIAAYKCPKSVEFVPSLPRNPSGKILKRVLRQPYWVGQARGVH